MPQVEFSVDSESLLSKLAFEWLAPFLSVGSSRPLEKDGWCILGSHLAYTKLVL